MTTYAVRVTGHLDESWASWFEGATVSWESDGTTTLQLTDVDQAQLHGLLARVRDLGISLVSVTVLPR